MRRHVALHTKYQAVIALGLQVGVIDLFAYQQQDTAAPTLFLRNQDIMVRGNDEIEAIGLRRRRQVLMRTGAVRVNGVHVQIAHQLLPFRHGPG